MTYLFNASNSERWLQQHRLPIELLDRFPDSIHRNHTCSKDGQIRWYHYDYGELWELLNLRYYCVLSYYTSILIRWE